MVSPGSTTVATLLEIVLVLLVPFTFTVEAVCAKANCPAHVRSNNRNAAEKAW
jgi:hypothetical protein